MRPSFLGCLTVIVWISGGAVFPVRASPEDEASPTSSIKFDTLRQAKSVTAKGIRKKGDDRRSLFVDTTLQVRTRALLQSGSKSKDKAVNAPSSPPPRAENSGSKGNPSPHGNPTKEGLGSSTTPSGASPTRPAGPTSDDGLGTTTTAPLSTVSGVLDATPVQPLATPEPIVTDKGNAVTDAQGLLASPLAPVAPQIAGLGIGQLSPPPAIGVGGLLPRPATLAGESSTPPASTGAVLLSSLPPPPLLDDKSPSPSPLSPLPPSEPHQPLSPLPPPLDGNSPSPSPPSLRPPPEPQQPLSPPPLPLTAEPTPSSQAKNAGDGKNAGGDFPVVGPGAKDKEGKGQAEEAKKDAKATTEVSTARDAKAPTDVSTAKDAKAPTDVSPAGAKPKADDARADDKNATAPTEPQGMPGQGEADEKAGNSAGKADPGAEAERKGVSASALGDSPANGIRLKGGADEAAAPAEVTGGAGGEGPDKDVRAPGTDVTKGVEKGTPLDTSPPPSSPEMTPPASSPAALEELPPVATPGSPPQSPPDSPSLPPFLPDAPRPGEKGQGRAPGGGDQCKGNGDKSRCGKPSKDSSQDDVPDPTPGKGGPGMPPNHDTATAPASLSPIPDVSGAASPVTASSGSESPGHSQDSAKEDRDRPKAKPCKNGKEASGVPCLPTSDADKEESSSPVEMPQPSLPDSPPPPTDSPPKSNLPPDVYPLPAPVPPSSPPPAPDSHGSNSQSSGDEHGNQSGNGNDCGDHGSDNGCGQPEKNKGNEGAASNIRPKGNEQLPAASPSSQPSLDGISGPTSPTQASNGVLRPGHSQGASKEEWDGPKGRPCEKGKGPLGVPCSATPDTDNGRDTGRGQSPRPPLPDCSPAPQERPLQLVPPANPSPPPPPSPDPNGITSATAEEEDIEEEEEQRRSPPPPREAGSPPQPVSTSTVVPQPQFSPPASPPPPSEQSNNGLEDASPSPPPSSEQSDNGLGVASPSPSPTQFSPPPLSFPDPQFLTLSPPAAPGELGGPPAPAADPTQKDRVPATLFASSPPPPPIVAATRFTVDITIGKGSDAIKEGILTSPTPPSPTLGQTIQSSSPTPTAQVGNPIAGVGGLTPAQPNSLVAADVGSHSTVSDATNDPAQDGAVPTAPAASNGSAEGNSTSANPELEPKGSAAGVQVTSQELEAVGFSPRPKENEECPNHPPYTLWPSQPLAPMAVEAAVDVPATTGPNPRRLLEGARRPAASPSTKASPVPRFWKWRFPGGMLGGKIAAATHSSYSQTRQLALHGPMPGAQPVTGELLSLLGKRAPGMASSGPERRLLQEEPSARRSAPPPPPSRICNYGDPFRKPEAGGCCQACKNAARTYTYYKDSDLNPVMCCLAIAADKAPVRGT